MDDTFWHSYFRGVGKDLDPSTATYKDGLKRSLKKHWKKLSLKLHPDKGGADHAFKELLRQFKMLLEGLERNGTEPFFTLLQNMTRRNDDGFPPNPAPAHDGQPDTGESYTYNTEGWSDEAWSDEEKEASDHKRPTTSDGYERWHSYIRELAGNQTWENGNLEEWGKYTEGEWKDQRDEEKRAGQWAKGKEGSIDHKMHAGKTLTGDDLLEYLKSERHKPASPSSLT